MNRCDFKTDGFPDAHPLLEVVPFLHQENKTALKQLDEIQLSVHDVEALSRHPDLMDKYGFPTCDVPSLWKEIKKIYLNSYGARATADENQLALNSSSFSFKNDKEGASILYQLERYDELVLILEDDLKKFKEFMDDRVGDDHEIFEKIIEEKELWLSFTKNISQKHKEGKPVPRLFEVTHPDGTKQHFNFSVTFLGNLNLFFHDLYSFKKENNIDFEILEKYFSALANFNNEVISLETIAQEQDPQTQERLRIIFASMHFENFVKGFIAHLPLEQRILIDPDNPWNHTLETVDKTKIAEELEEAKNSVQNATQLPYPLYPDEQYQVRITHLPGLGQRSHIRSNEFYIVFDAEDIFIPRSKWDALFHEFTHIFTPKLCSSNAKVENKYLCEGIAYWLSHKLVNEKFKEGSSDIPEHRNTLFRYELDTFKRVGDNTKIIEEFHDYSLGALFWQDVEKKLGMEGVQKILQEYEQLGRSPTFEEKMGTTVQEYLDNRIKTMSDHATFGKDLRLNVGFSPKGNFLFEAGIHLFQIGSVRNFLNIGVQLKGLGAERDAAETYDIQNVLLGYSFLFPPIIPGKRYAQGSEFFEFGLETGLAFLKVNLNSEETDNEVHWYASLDTTLWSYGFLMSSRAGRFGLGFKVLVTELENTDGLDIPIITNFRLTF